MIDDCPLDANSAAAGQRRIIINADDFGERKFNESIAAAFTAQMISSATMLVGRDGFDEAAEATRANDWPVGLHLNLTVGPPVADPSLIRTLVGDDSEFLGSDALRRRLAADQVDPEDIEVETSAQLARFHNLLGPPTHVDGHHHIHVEPSVAQVVAPLLRAAGVRWIRMPIEDEQHFQHIAPKRLAWAQRLMDSARVSAAVFATHHLRWPSYMGMGYGWDDCTLDRVGGRLRALPVGVTEYMVHIAMPGSLPPTDSAYERRVEWVLLASRAFTDLLVRERIELVSFGDL